MELKVRVDGIQRVVCGLNRNTTCQDVVLALAVATSQVGRFTLIEKFRNNERFLSPGEKPIQVLSKWGEYANDVQFVLKRSCDTLNNNQLLTEQRCNQHSKSCSRNGHSAGHSGDEPLQLLAKDWKDSPRVSRDDRPSKRKEQTPSRSSLRPDTFPEDRMSADNVTNPRLRRENGAGSDVYGLISTQTASHSDQQQPLTRPQHPPSYESVTRSICHPTASANHSSPKKRTSQETAQPHAPTRDDGSGQASHNRLTGKRMNSHAVPAEQLDPRRVQRNVRTQQEVIASDPDSDHNEKRKSDRSSRWEADLQEIRIKDEYDRKKLEKNNLLLKASGLEAEIAVCRQKIQLLNDQIREEEHRMETEQRKKDLHEEAKVKESIDCLKEQISQCEQDLQRQNRESEEIQSELRELEETLCLKYEEMEEVMKEIRKENLNALSMEVPARTVLSCSPLNSASDSPFLKLHSEVVRRNLSASLLGSRFYNRIGSTRKMLTSPRDLETAVASNKNPQGIWV